MLLPFTHSRSGGFQALAAAAIQVLVQSRTRIYQGLGIVPHAPVSHLTGQKTHLPGSAWFLCAGMFSLAVTGVWAQSADSVYLDYQEGLSQTGDVLMTDMSIDQNALYTFYAALVWDTGYLGLQRSGDGYDKDVHAAVWDPPCGGYADLVWSDTDVVTARFGGEGMGWKVAWPFTWSEGASYRFCVKLTNASTNTDYDTYFFDPSVGTWKHLATLRRHDGPHAFSYASTFVEDFAGTLSSARSAYLGNGWLRTMTGDWVELLHAQFATQGPQTNKNAVVSGNQFWLGTGGTISNSTPPHTTLARSAFGKLPNDLSLTVAPPTAADSIQLSWRTLPFYIYYVDWSDDLSDWPASQSILTSTNTWADSVQGRAKRFYRIEVTE